MARSASRFAPLLCLAALMAVSGPAFLQSAPSAVPSTAGEKAEAGAALQFGAAAAAYSMPLAASADAGLPTPVLGIGLLSVIVVIVLIVTGIVVARGLIANEENGDI
eukprot:CAMPEP_0179054232 /NCGR_PEP_ID=MMETSP0796-20121207/22680_1 /TAXON_ID=73915 /ORGANISM="Pyrodinium bahamense, Strain pbaha01" /LENGTH=106 /DNA_ID=CAMNT_0020750849 /DNA_START=84 /DNA_END=404 /DNA_ORIENTATION=+